MPRYCCIIGVWRVKSTAAVSGFVLMRAGLSCGGETETEGRAGARLRLRLDRAAMAFQQALDDGQADAGAGKFVVRVQALERLEQHVGPRGVESGAVVAHEDPAILVA